MCVFPINKKKIFISNFQGKPYGESPKYVVEELLKRDKSYKIYWLVTKEFIKEHVDGIEYIELGSLKAKYHMATSKFWLDNARKTFYVPKRKKQIYIQLWHGIGPKMAEKDIELSLSKEYVKYAKNDSKMTDYILSPAEKFTKDILPAFWFDGPVLDFGLPRNDILKISDTRSYRKNLEKFLNENLDQKILLYAPTFRKNLKKNKYDLDLIRLKENLEKTFGGTYSILVRYHPNIPLEKNKNDVNSIIKDVSLYPDMAELLAISDCFITDYSSSLNDYILTNKIALVYASDIQEFNQDRGFYYKLEQVTGFVAENNDELEEYLNKFDFADYKVKINKFKKDIGLNEEFNASNKVVDLLLSLNEK